jgi:hypothetical protein
MFHIRKMKVRDAHEDAAWFAITSLHIFCADRLISPFSMPHKNNEWFFSNFVDSTAARQV